MSFPRTLIHGTLVELCFSTEEGLPLVATAYMEAIIYSVLARAQSLYPVTICHFVVMSNHFHMLIVVDYIEDVPAFVCYVKRELAHAINKLRGRKRRTVWIGEYDCPVILDEETARKRIAYIYSNPVNAGLVESIDEYPNVSSWNAFLKGGEEKCVNRIPRTCFFKLAKENLTIEEQHEIARKLTSQGLEECSLKIEPDAWMKCFNVLKDKDPHEVNTKIISQIRRNEEKIKEERSVSVIGAEQLKHEPINKSYESERKGKHMFCISIYAVLRKAFIDYIRSMFKKETKNSKVDNDKSFSYALPSLFLAGGKLVANLVPLFVPTANTIYISP